MHSIAQSRMITLSLAEHKARSNAAEAKSAGKSAGPDLPGPGDLRAGPGVGVREGVHGDVGPFAADSVGDGVDGAQ